MSQLDSNLASGGVLVQKPRSNVYTVMLALSLVALLVGIFFLWLELKAYNYEINGPVGSAVYETGEFKSLFCNGGTAAPTATAKINQDRGLSKKEIFFVAKTTRQKNDGLVV